jgi:parallel beta-helix repeat protein
MLTSLLGALFLSGQVGALYVPPPETFITDPNEQKVVLTINSGTIAQVQSQINAARQANPDAVIVVRLSGTYEVGAAPLSLPAKSCLVLSGTIRAATGATAGALVSVDGRMRVSIAGGRYDGRGARLHGIRVAGASGVNIDGVTVSGAALTGIHVTGPGSAVWDAGSTITRAEVSGSGAAGIQVLSATRVLILDSHVHDNGGPGIDLGSSAHHGSVVNNRSARNAVGVNVDGRDNAVSDNTLNGNRRGLVLGGGSANNAALQNVVAGNTEVGIALAGSNNLVFANTLFGNPSTLSSSGTGNYVVPDSRSLPDSTNRYFYPPTIRNRHSDGRIVNGRSRVDVFQSGTSLASVQQAYNAARTANPDAFIVLHMNGAFTHGGAPLSLSSYTALVLNGRIDVVSGAAGPVIRGGAGTQFLSISGGTIDGHNFVMEGINVDIGTMVLIDRVTVRNFGQENPRSRSNSIHLTHGTGYSIVRGCRVDVSGGRAIWTQHSSSRYVVVGNHSTNANMDGIDFDSHTANSLAKDNLAESNTRYGLFIEEGAQQNKAYNNTLIGNHIGLNYVSNATGPTRRNTAFANRLIRNNHGLRTVGSEAFTTDHNFFFNNLVQDQAVDSIRAQGVGEDNFFSNDIIQGNTTLHLTVTPPPVFFNSLSAPVAPPGPQPITLFFEAESTGAATSRTSRANTVVLNESAASGGRLIQFGTSPPAVVGDWIELTLPNVPAGTYEVVLKYKTHSNRGIHNLAVDGRGLNGTLDQFSTGGASYPEKSFGTVQLGAGDHVVRLTVVGKRAESGSFSITADRITLVPSGDSR